MNKTIRSIAAAAITAGALALGTSSAGAAAPTGDFKPFEFCPYTNTAVFSCMYSETTSGTFTLGNAAVPINKTLKLQGGFTSDPEGAGPTTFYNAVGADTLVKTGLNVPGGLLGLMDPGGFGSVLYDAFIWATQWANGVTSTAERTGPVGFEFENLLFQSGTAVTLPIRVHLENTFLGPDCYIGTALNPITLKLTTGTTAPTAPNTPISGSGGAVSSNPDGSVVTAAGVKLVDNDFAVPAASGCGFTFVDRPLVTAAVNLKEGFPSPKGKNTAILQGTTKIGNRAMVQASVQ